MPLAKSHSMNTQKFQLFCTDLQSANYIHIDVTSVFFSEWIIEYRFSCLHSIYIVDLWLSIPLSTSLSPNHISKVKHE